jgi:hypothetical protein
MLFINWLAKVADDPFVQGADPVNIIGVGSHEDCRNRAPCIDEVFMELEPGHRRHMDVSDQAGGFGETRRCEEIGCRREGRDVVAKRAGPRELLISTEQMQTGGVLVSVRDSGPGIDPEHLERVFEAFYTTKSSGVGMGLSICRSIIDAHGGRLWADVNEPRSAVFQFTLPGAEGEFMSSLQSVHRT